MSFPFFLYRRLSRWITCEFNLFESSKVSLQTKFEVASFKDVFCHPFYWQISEYLETVPKLIVDCGAHCGHFSVLANICIKSKFEQLSTKYLLVEPNPYLLPVLKKTVKEAGFLDRAEIHQGILGQKRGSDTFWIDPKNYLATGLEQKPTAKPHRINYLDLQPLLKEQQIDLMKIDIEGGEFEFVDANLDVLKRTHLIFMELHASSKDKKNHLIEQLNSVGLNMTEAPSKSHGQELVVFKR